MDTLCASLGQGMLVDLTVQEKRQGKTLDEAAAFAEKNRLYLCHWFTVGDLSQLRRGGRLSAGKAIVGNLLNIKPVLHVDDEGHLVPMASAKGRKKSIEALVSHMEESAVAPEQQRVYIARAIVNRPPLLICDEPTGNLDPQTSRGIMDLLERINRTGTTVLVATHDREMVDNMRRRVIALDRGRLTRDQDRGVYGFDA